MKEQNVQVTEIANQTPYKFAHRKTDSESFSRTINAELELRAHDDDDKQT